VRAGCGERAAIITDPATDTYLYIYMNIIRLISSPVCLDPISAGMLWFREALIISSTLG